jgi:hypothetical protein
MKSQQILLVLVLIIMLMFLNCQPDCDLDQNRKIAIRKYEDILFQQKIDPSLFSGPMLNLENPKYFIFEWNSKIPKAGALKINIYVPVVRNCEQSEALIGSESDWLYVVNTLGTNLKNTLVSNLFDEKIKDTLIDTLPVENDSVIITYMIDFIVIKNRLINYFFEFKKYPIDISELNAEWQSLTDGNGKKYIYKAQNNFVILGTYGKNNKCDIGKLAFDTFFKNAQVGMLKGTDDFFVKILPVDR